MTIGIAALPVEICMNATMAARAVTMRSKATSASEAVLYRSAPGRARHLRPLVDPVLRRLDHGTRPLPNIFVVRHGQVRLLELGAVWLVNCMPTRTDNPWPIRVSLHRGICYGFEELRTPDALRM